MEKETPEIKDVLNVPIKIEKEVSELKANQNDAFSTVLAEKQRLCAKLPCAKWNVELLSPFNEITAKLLTSTDKYSQIFPIQDEDFLYKLESGINEDNSDEMITHIKNIIGSGGIQNNISAIFSSDLIMQYNVDGSRNKKRLLKFQKVLDSLYKATMNDERSYAEFLQELKRGFRLMKNREYAKNFRKKRKNRKQPRQFNDTTITQDIINDLPSMCDSPLQSNANTTCWTALIYDNNTSNISNASNIINLVDNPGSLVASPSNSPFAYSTEDPPYTAQSFISSTNHTNKYSNIFPIQDEESLFKLESELNEDNSDEMIIHVQNIIGSGGLHRNTSAIFSSDVVMQYNVDGNRNKKRLINFKKVLDSLYKATMKDGCSYTDFLKELKKGLRFMKSRQYTENFRKKNTNIEQPRQFNDTTITQEDIINDLPNMCDSPLQSNANTTCWTALIDDNNTSNISNNSNILNLVDNPGSLVASPSNSSAYTEEDPPYTPQSFISSTNHTNKYSKIFPIQDEESLIKLESELNEDNSDEMITYVQNIIGSGGIHRNTSAIFSLDVVMQYNVDGINNKNCLLNFKKVLDSLYKATMKDGCSYTDFLKELRKGLRFMKNRHYTENFRKKKTNIKQPKFNDTTSTQDIINDLPYMYDSPQHSNANTTCWTALLDDSTTCSRSSDLYTPNHSSVHNPGSLAAPPSNSSVIYTHEDPPYASQSFISSTYNTNKYSKIFPIKDEKNLFQLESELNEHNSDEIINHVKNIIGSGGLRRNTSAIFSPEIVTQYNVYGNYTKKGLLHFKKVLDIIYKATMTDESSYSDFLEELQNGFRLIRKRLYNRKRVKRKQKIKQQRQFNDATTTQDIINDLPNMCDSPQQSNTNTKCWTELIDDRTTCSSSNDSYTLNHSSVHNPGSPAAFPFNSSFANTDEHPPYSPQSFISFTNQTNQTGDFTSPPNSPALSTLTATKTKKRRPSKEQSDKPDSARLENLPESERKKAKDRAKNKEASRLSLLKKKKKKAEVEEAKHLIERNLAMIAELEYLNKVSSKLTRALQRRQQGLLIQVASHEGVLFQTELKKTEMKEAQLEEAKHLTGRNLVMRAELEHLKKVSAKLERALQHRQQGTLIQVASHEGVIFETVKNHTNSDNEFVLI